MSTDDYPKVSINVEDTSLLDDETVRETASKTKEDSRFKSWHETLAKRKEIYKLLERRVNRKPDELLMNAFEDAKVIQDEKLMFEYAKIPKADPQRGCPNFWKLPLSLNEPCDLPKYFAVPSKLDGCDIPDIEYVKVPNIIKKEKEATTRRYYEILQELYPYIYL